MRYVVVSSLRGVAPRPHMHRDQGLAEREAERLARANPGDSFAVWEVRFLAEVKKNDVTSTKLDRDGQPDVADDDIPF